MIRKRIKGQDDESIYWLIKHELYPITLQAIPETKLIRSEQINRINLGNTFVKENDDGEVVGFVTFFCASDPGWIDMLAVHPQARQKGIGSQLMEKAQSESLQHGVCTLALYVDGHNDVGIYFYETLGFFVAEYIPEHKCYHMMKRLDG